MRVLWLALASIALSVAGQFALKAGMTAAAVRSNGNSGMWRGLSDALSEPFVLGGLVLYGLSALVWLGVLARWDVSKAYPLVGLGFALTVIVGALAGEQVGWVRVVGVLLICTGVALVARS
jgi:multidrug transporter EmrE-like cation transporter